MPDALNFSYTEQSANAMGVHLDTRKQWFDLPAKDASTSKNALVHRALSPIFRQLVQQYVTPGEREGAKGGLARIEETFAKLFVAKLAPGRGAPSVFKQCCKALEINEADSNWILHVVITSVLQGIVRHYADNLSAPGMQNTDEDEETDVPPDDGGGDATILGRELRSAGLLPPSEEAPASSASSASRRADVSLPDDSRWQSHQKAVDHIWNNMSLSLLLRRGDDFTSRWVEKSLALTSGSRKAHRFKALGVTAQTKLALQAALASPSDLESGILSQAELRRRATEFCAVLLDLVLATLGTNRAPAIILTENSGRDVRRLKPSDALLRSLTKIETGIRLTDPAGPIATKPKPWDMKGAKASGLTSGGFFQKPLDFYKFNVKNDVIRSFVDRMSQDAAAYQPFFEAVNALQDTSWRINRRVWQVQKALIKASDDPDVVATGLGDVFDDIPLTNSIHSKWKSWLETSFFARREPSGASAKKKPLGAKSTASPGWRLVSPAGAAEVMRLLDKPNFWFAYNIDSRGRIYPIGSYLHPQSEDTFRALLEFGTEEPITEKGVRWLALHGSQCVSRSLILRDLRVTGRSLPTIDERVQWVERMTRRIRECAQDPLECTWWRDVGEKSAFQFLAFCFAWDDYKKGGALTKCSLPIHVDGTCNGLQHIAALTGDYDLAKAVNLVPGPPADIYSQVARQVQARAADVERRLPLDDQRGRSAFERVMAQALQSQERELRSIIAARPNLIGRDAAKSVVMVIPYGAGVATYARQLAEDIAEQKDDPQLRSWLERGGLAMVNVLDHHSDAEPSPKAESKGKGSRKLGAALPHVKKDESWKPLYFGRLMLATLLAREFQIVLKEQFPVIERFKDWLHELTKAVTNRDLGMVWVSPAGLPVLQNGFKTDVQQIDVKGVHRIRLSHYVLKEEISVRRQMLGILPNFIHSLDSSHLVATVRKTRNQGARSFSMIHDSFGTHAAHMPVLAENLREAFAELYAVDRLDELRRFLTQLLDNPLGFAIETEPRERTKGELAKWATREVTMADIARIEPLPVFEREPSAFDIADVKGSLYFFA